MSVVPWVCGGRYRPVLCSVSPPDYLSLLTSLHPLEDRDTVEVWTFQYYQYFIFRFDNNWWLHWQRWSDSGGVRTLHRPTLSAAWSPGQEIRPHQWEYNSLWRSGQHGLPDHLPHSHLIRDMGENHDTAREQVIWLININNERNHLFYFIDKFDTRILYWSLPWSLSQSLTLSTIFLPNERENILVSSVCESVGIKYSSQILQSCSKLGRSFRHSVSFQCLFKLRN